MNFVPLPAENRMAGESFDLSPVDNRRWSRDLGLWLVAGYLVLFLIRPWEILAPQLGTFRIERIYAVVMIAVVLITGRTIRWNLQSAAVVLFAASVAISSVCAWQPQYAWPELYRYLTVVVTYFLMLAVCRAPRDLFLLIGTYIGSMFLYLAKSLWEYFIHGRHEFAQGVPRLLGIESTYGEPNAVAMSAAVSLPIWLFLFRCRHELTWQWRPSWRRSYLLTVYAYPLLVTLAVWLTNSRAGMLGLAAFVFAALFVRSEGVRPMRALLLVTLLLGGLWLITPGQQKDRMRTLWDPQAGPENAHASAEGRWQGFLAACQMLRDEPFTGIGVGNFVAYRVAYIDGVPLVAHNLPGQILGEMGWIGGIGFGLMVYALLRNATLIRRTCRLEDQPSARVFHELALACQVSVLLLFLFGASLHNGLRYNWVWLAAFCSLTLEFCLLSVEDLGPDETVR
jgi:O-antigen ligase